MLKTAGTFISFDARSLARDQLLYLVGFIIVLAFGGIAVAGVFREQLGIGFLETWIPYLMILALISNPASYGMIFGLLLIEEIETRARAALMVTPVAPIFLIILRTPLLVAVLTLVGVILTWGIGVAWGISEVALAHWFALSFVAALLGPVVMISISTVASNRVEAMAVGKFFSGLLIPPMFLYLLPADAFLRWLFLIFPTAPLVHAYDAMRAEAFGTAYSWLVFGAFYTLVLTALAVRRYLRKSYQSF